MIIDSTLEFCDATDVHASAGTALVGNVVDLSVIGRNVGNGQPVYLVINVDTAIITGGSAGTVQFKLATDSTATIATDGSATDIILSPVFTTDEGTASPFTAGSTILCQALPSALFNVTDNAHTYERYMGLLCVTATTATTAGKINAFLTLDPVGWKPYADAVN